MRLKKFNNYHKVEEGWKQNLLLSLSLLISNPTFSNKIHKVDQMEQSTDYTKDFWKACFQVCEELKSPKMSIEERAGILEAQIYFQSKRDGAKYDKLSNRGVAVSKIVMEKVSKLSNHQIDDLVQRGSSGHVSGSITGL